MSDRPTPTHFQHRIGIVVLVMAVAVAVTPLALALAIRNSDTSTRSTLLLLAALLWLLAVVAYRGLALAHEHSRRRTLRKELAATRRARLDSSATFQDKMNDQHAILDRIAAISETLLEEGIIDPQLAISNVRLISSHAREAQALVEDTITEIRVEIGSATADIETFDTRDEIEAVVAPFVRSGVRIATGGPRHFAETDPAMFRLIVRGLVAGALERQAEEIDVSVARDGDAVVCTVSDNGLDNSREGLAAVTPVTWSVAHTVGADVEFSRALGRNQYSIAVPAAATPEFARRKTMPLDVLGHRPSSSPEPPHVTDHPQRPTARADETITFPTDADRDLTHTVAARRERYLTSR